MDTTRAAIGAAGRGRNVQRGMHSRFSYTFPIFRFPTLSLLSFPLFAPSYTLLVIFIFHLTMADAIDDNDEEPALARMVSALAQRELPIAGRSHAAVVGGGRQQGIGAEVLPAQVFRSPRPVMLVQPQERLLSQHLQARLLVAILVAGGDSGLLVVVEARGGDFGCWWRLWLLVVVEARWRSTKMLTIGTDMVFLIGTDKSLER